MLKKKYRIVDGYYFIKYKYTANSHRDICRSCKFHKDNINRLCSDIIVNGNQEFLDLCRKSSLLELKLPYMSEITYYPDQNRYYYGDDCSINIIKR